MPGQRNLPQLAAKRQQARSIPYIRKKTVEAANPVQRPDGPSHPRGRKFVQPFELDTDSDYDNRDPCRKKSEVRLIRTIQEHLFRVLWQSGIEERLGQMFRQVLPNYRALARLADERDRQTDFDFGYLAEDIDYFCGD